MVLVVCLEVRHYFGVRGLKQQQRLLPTHFKLKRNTEAPLLSTPEQLSRSCGSLCWLLTPSERVCRDRLEFGEITTLGSRHSLGDTAAKGKAFVHGFLT